MTSPSVVASTVAWSALSDQRDYLVRYARRRLSDVPLAEDLVHDVFETVAAGRARFDARSTLRTWLVAILKHKIVDFLRDHACQCSLDALTEDSDAAFAHHLVSAQPGPAEQCEQRERLAQALAQIEALPASLRRPFELAVLSDQPTAQVCSALAISPANLWVRVHRARRLLAA